MPAPVWHRYEASPRPVELSERVDVLIVGGGPVGLTLALDLARRNRRVTVINKLDYIAAGSKAICFSKRSLDIWNRLRVADAMIGRGVVWDRGKVFWGSADRPIYEFDLMPVKFQKTPAFINLQQYRVEEVLVEALRELPNVDLRWGHTLRSVTADAQAACASVVSIGGSYTISAQWLIACDGHRSAVREQLGKEFEGRVFEDNFLIADIKLKAARPAERWFWFDPPFNPGRSALLHKQPDDIWRLDFQLTPDVDREACVLPHNVEPLVRGMLGEDTEFRQEWYSVYTFQCRRMHRFVHDRVIFAGDSAHLLSPFGARGCNGGLADADNLGWKLELVLRGEADARLLESYNDEAVRAADENIRNSTRSTDFMTPKDPASVALRDSVLQLASKYSFARPFVNSGRLATAMCHAESFLNTPDEEHSSWLGIPPGSIAMDAPLDEHWLLDLLGDEFVILAMGWGCAPIEGTRQLDLARWGADAGIAMERFDLRPRSAYLIRPDQYVAARWREPSENLLRAAILRAKGIC